MATFVTMQTIIKLHFYEGKKLREVGEILNVSVSTFKTQKAKGLASLRKKLPAAAYALLIALAPHNLITPIRVVNQ